MKFSNGCWLQKEGCSAFGPAEVYFIKVSDKEVTICAPTNPVYNRGCTLGGINLTIKITAPHKDVLRVQTYHHLGTVKKNPEFELNMNNQPLEVTEEENLLIIKTKPQSSPPPWNTRSLLAAAGMAGITSTKNTPFTAATMKELRTPPAVTIPC